MAHLRTHTNGVAPAAVFGLVQTGERRTLTCGGGRGWRRRAGVRTVESGLPELGSGGAGAWAVLG